MGKTRLPEAKIDRLFAISTAAVTMDANLDLMPDGQAGLCFKPMESSYYESARNAMYRTARRIMVRSILASSPRSAFHLIIS
jgi:hypothetical protein